MVPEGVGRVQESRTIDAVERDQKRWALPTDPYDLAMASVLEASAYEVKHLACMRSHGVTDLPRRWDIAAPPPETLAADGSSMLFNEMLAEKYGYRAAPDPRDLLEAEILAAGDESILSSRDSSFHQIYEDCHSEVTEEFFEMSAIKDLPEVEGVLNSYDKLRVDLRSQELAQAAQLWRDCMRPQGVSDLPDTPWPVGTLPESLHDRWDWRLGGSASEDERSLAMADASCRRSSGWFDALYEAEWDLRESFVKEHREELEAIRRGLEINEERYRDIIEEGAGVL